MQGTTSDLVDAVLGASRALVAVAARSLADVADEVTLPQYRALVVLRTREQVRSVDLADELRVTAPTAGRMVDRLVRKGLVTRSPSDGDRREVNLALTAAGRQIVDDVTCRRREEIERIVDQLPPGSRAAVVDALTAFAHAAGETSDWALGW